MSGTQASLDWEAFRGKAGPYPPQAYRFVREGLAHTVRLVHGAGEESGPERHVDGKQLCLGLRDHAIRRYGLLAGTVLSSWSIRATEDFGRIVFAMIEAGLMRKSDEDTLEDFRDVYDFEEAFAAAEVC